MLENLRSFQSLEHLKLKITFWRCFFYTPSTNLQEVQNLALFGHLFPPVKTYTGLSLKKTLHVWLSHTKTMFYCYGLRF